VAAESTEVGERRAVVNHARARVATAGAATARFRDGSGLTEPHLGFGLPGDRSACSNRFAWEWEPHSPTVDGPADWAA